MRYILSTGRTDMHKVISLLCGVVHGKIKSEEKKGDAFIFISSNCTFINGFMKNSDVCKIPGG